MENQQDVKGSFNATFKTNNRPLAFALILAGCTLAPQSQDGPTLNLYTLGFLRGIPAIRGKEIEEGVQWCVDKKIPGNVTYLFLRNETLETAIATWDAMHASWVEADQKGDPHPVPDIDTETVMKVLFLYANSLEKLGELPWFNTPQISDHTANTREEALFCPDGVQRPAPKTITEGIFRQWSLGASQETKERLGVI